MNWKRLTIQVLTAASAALRFSTGYGQNCCCCRQINAHDQTTPKVQSTDPSRFQPLGPNNGIFGNSRETTSLARETTSLEGSSSGPEPDLRAFSSGSGNQPVPDREASPGGSGGGGSGIRPAPGGGPIPGTTSGTPGARPVPGTRPNPGNGPGSGGGPGTPPPATQTPAATRNDESSRVPTEVPQTDRTSDDSSSLLVTVNPPDEQLPDPVPDLPNSSSDPPIRVTPPPTNSPEDTPVVPEPGSLLLLSLGTSLGGMMWVKRTSRKNAIQPKP